MRRPSPAIRSEAWTAWTASTASIPPVPGTASTMAGHGSDGAEGPWSPTESDFDDVMTQYYEDAGTPELDDL